MTRIGVLVSGGGTNLQALLDAQTRGEIPGGEIVLVVSSKRGAKALERAAARGVPTAVVSRKELAPELFDMMLCAELARNQVDLVVLAGFLSVLGPGILARYQNRIINIHPSLIPAFAGPGMYGLRVHRAALDRGVRVTGATVHMVNDVVDGGKILLQQAVEVQPEDTPETLQHRVMEEAEWKLLPQAVAMFCRGEFKEEHNW